MSHFQGLPTLAEVAALLYSSEFLLSLRFLKYAFGALSVLAVVIGFGFGMLFAFLSDWLNRIVP